MNQEVIVCPICGENCKAEQVRCVQCGARLQARLPKVKTVLKAPTILFRNIFLVIVSLLLLISSFLPIAKFRMSVDAEGVEPYFLASPFQSIVFLFDSLHSQSSSELMDCALYDKFETSVEWLEEAYEESDYITVPVARRLNKFYRYSIRLWLMHYNQSPTIEIVTAALLSLAYLIFTILFALYSVLNLAYVCAGKGSFLKNVYACFGVLPFLFVLTYAAQRAYVYNFYCKRVTVYMVLCLVVMLLLLFYLCVDAFLRRAQKGKERRRILLPLLSVLCATMILISVFLPSLSFKVARTFSGNDRKKNAVIYFDASIYDSFTSLEQTDYKADYEAKFDALGYYKYTEIKAGEADAYLEGMAIDKIAAGAKIAGNVQQDLQKLALLPLLAIMACVGAIVMVSERFSYLWLGYKNKWKQFIGVGVSVLFALLFLIFNILCVSYAQNIIWASGTSRLSISVAPILFLVASILSGFMFLFEKKKQ